MLEQVCPHICHCSEAFVTQAESLLADLVPTVQQIAA